MYLYIYIYVYILSMTCKCLTHVQVLNYDRRLTPSHPDPVEPGKKAFRNLKSLFQAAIVHKEDHFQLQWAMKVLHNKSDEELAALAFRVSGCQFGIIHVITALQIFHRESVKDRNIQIPCSLWPCYQSERRKRELAPMQFEKIEAIRIYQSPLTSMAIEQGLHVEMRLKYGNVCGPEVSSNELTQASICKQSCICCAN